MKAEREMAIRDVETMDSEAENAIGGGLSSLENFAALAKLYRTTLIPQAEQSVQSNIEAYRVGTIDFPMMMDSLMSELGFRREYVGMVGEMHMAKARLEAVVGRELDGAAPVTGESVPPRRIDGTERDDERRKDGGEQETGCPGTGRIRKEETAPDRLYCRGRAGPGRRRGIGFLHDTLFSRPASHPPGGQRRDGRPRRVGEVHLRHAPVHHLDKPGNCPICGMTLTKIEDAGTTTAAGGGAPKGERKLLFYRNPMNPQITSKTPAKDEMGMDYVPVYEDEAKGSGAGVDPPEGYATVQVGMERAQMAGIQSATAVREAISHPVRAVGIVVPDERGVRRVQSKVEGWVEKLHTNFVGQMVTKGQPLLEIYSPDLVATQREYLLAREGVDRMKESPYEDAREMSSGLAGRPGRDSISSMCRKAPSRSWSARARCGAPSR